MPLSIAPQLQETAAAASSSLGGGAGPDLTWMTAIVAVFVVMIAAIAFFFRKVVGGSLRSRASKRDLQVIDVLPLGGKRQLAVVRCYDRTFAIGLSEKSVGLLAELDTEVVRTDRAAETGERAEAFIARLENAKARLLGVREVVPAQVPDRSSSPSPSQVTPQTRASDLGETPPTSASSTREFIA